ncbi:MAG: 4Fe-4S double cluster binding domain-containing protein [Methanomassiliicoccales archaeon]
MLTSIEVKQAASRLGFSVVGITDAQPFHHHIEALRRRNDEDILLMSTLDFEIDIESIYKASFPTELLSEAKSIISLSLGYLIEEELSNGDGTPRGRLARVHWWDCLGELERRRTQLIQWLEQKGVRCVVSPGSPEKAIASRAGLGSYGKNSNIQTLEDGSWNALGSIITDAPLEPDEPMAPRCGSCRRCIGFCPTKAIIEPYVVDTKRCLSHLLLSPRPIPLEFRDKVGDRLTGCDACQEICPRNWYVVPRAAEGLPGRSPSSISIQSILDNEIWISKIIAKEHTPLAPQLHRNAMVILGNSTSEEAISILVRSLGHPESQVRSHAAWSLGKHGGNIARKALEEAMAKEKDEKVMEEMISALERGWP